MSIKDQVVEPELSAKERREEAVMRARRRAKKVEGIVKETGFGAVVKSRFGTEVFYA